MQGTSGFHLVFICWYVPARFVPDVTIGWRAPRVRTSFSQVASHGVALKDGVLFHIDFDMIMGSDRGMGSVV